MKKLSTNGVKTLKIFHLIFVMMWIVGIVAMAIIYLMEKKSGDELYMSFKITRVIDDLLVAVGGMGTFFTALIYSIWTNWGFFKHRWVTVKWIVAVILILFGTFVLSPWLDISLEAADKFRDTAFANEDLVFYSRLTFIFAVINTLILLFLVAISVFKPWRKKKK